MPIPQSTKDFFLKDPAHIVQLELLEISHPSISQTYRIVKNDANGVTFQGHFYEYYPCSIKPAYDFQGLDFEIEVQLGDLGEIIPKELHNIQVAETQKTPIKVNYYILRSDDLSQAMFSFTNLEAKNFTFNKQGSNFTAKAQGLNTYTTGETYNLKDYPYLAGFL